MADGLNDRLECPVCISFLCEPITLGCGHSFCRLCLVKTTHLSPDGRSCPLCRTTIAIPDIKTHAVSEELERSIAAVVPAEAIDCRREASRAELDELLKAANSELPIFFMPPSTAVGAPVMLHFFEPRYKILIRRTWEGNRVFVYCSDVPRPGGRGVLVRVDHARFLPDGRANIVGQGVQVVTLGAVWVEEGTGGLFHTRVPDVLQMHTSVRQSRAAIGDGGGDNGSGDESETGRDGSAAPPCRGSCSIQ